uniref:Uncharacterized protein n=1 Tax=Anguilla anguilla TaxID=7936 RepID=A0A0E9W4T8_ANGAN
MNLQETFCSQHSDHTQSITGLVVLSCTTSASTGVIVLHLCKSCHFTRL